MKSIFHALNRLKVFRGLTEQEFAWVLYDVGNSAFTMLSCSLIPIWFKSLAIGTAPGQINSHQATAYYSIAACAAMSMLLVQLALNVFGSLDLLPFTGVTFPFVSRGGTSLISCWMLMAFIKSSDTRRNASFAVRPGRGKDDEEEGNTPASDNGFAPEDDPANWEVWQPCEK